jgi:hypothetical protein
MRISQANGLLFDAALERARYGPPKGKVVVLLDCDKLSGTRTEKTYQSSLSFLLAGFVNFVALESV